METYSSLTELRASLAMRVEDARIARKHEAEAAGRIGTPENVAAYNRARRWADTCREREQAARAALTGAVAA